MTEKSFNRRYVQLPTRKNLFFFAKNTPEYNEKIKEFQSIAEESGFTIVEDVNQANIIASLGGDNAFLQALRKTNFKEDCVYIGVSTDKPGFYTDFTMEDMTMMIEAIKNEEVEVRRYPTIEVTIDDDSPFYCINECSIRSNVIKTFVIDVYIDDLQFETFRGDGMIISTPTGSTAYNKSVNGAVVDPLLPSMQVSEIASLNNNDFRTLGTSFLLSPERTLLLKVVQDGNDHPIIGLDNEALSIRHSKEINIRLSGKYIKVLKLKNNSFWQKVQRKFL
ncbi:NAD kinase [Alkalihalobacillus sp. LMS39]|uniref:NAD kinase n=1 Tax=Alkalihalobacillus sp. LMS39 TaxID=2924032 RepID=UPI001FB3BCA7|nr:NAD kinase [Alkalihalobacillus sp. LMS39]UOE93452.1 NAD kinase [Alkalihalobacillus sp. LMS39]